MSRRLAVLTVAALACLATLPILPAWAGPGISAQPEFPSLMRVDEGPLPVSLTITNEGDAETGEPVAVSTIRLAPSCETFPGSPECHMPKAGVFTLSATGTGSQGCAGHTFDLSAPDSQGIVNVAPRSPLTLGPATASGVGACVIAFLVDQVHLEFPSGSSAPSFMEAGAHVAVEGTGTTSSAGVAAAGFDVFEVLASNSTFGIDLSTQATPGSLPAPGGEFTFAAAMTNVGSEALAITALSDTVYGDVTNLAGSTCESLLGRELRSQEVAECSYKAGFTGAQGAVQKNSLLVEAYGSTGARAFDTSQTEVQLTGDGVPTSMTLAPGHEVKDVRTLHTFVATVKDQNGRPLAGIPVTFTYIEGVGNCGCMSMKTTDNNGRAEWVDDANQAPTTNTVEAGFQDAEGVSQTARASVTWIDPDLGEICNGRDEDGDGVADDGFTDSDGDGIADCADTDQDGDTVEDGADNCVNVADGTQKDADGDRRGDACDPESPTISSPQSNSLSNTDGQFGPGSGEWANANAATFAKGESKMMAVRRSGDLTVMFDVRTNDVALQQGQEVGPISFQGGAGRYFDVFVNQGGNNSNFGPNPSFTFGGTMDSVRVLLNGKPFDNSAGCIRGAVDRNSSSPNFTEPHNLVELSVRTGAGGCAEQGPSFWTASLPGVGGRTVVAAATIASDDAGVVGITPVGEGRSGDRSCSDGVDNDGDGDPDSGDVDCVVPPVPNLIEALLRLLFP
jgi:hypothetical protein